MADVALIALTLLLGAVALVYVRAGAALLPGERDER